jgi:hypothetical protein
MAPPTVDFDTVRKLARELGDVEDATLHGVKALKVRGKLLAWIPPHKNVEPGSLAVRVTIEDRAAFIADAPEVYYFTEHYRNYPTVLVRMSRIRPDALKDLLRMSWSLAVAKPAAKKRRPKPRRS